MKKGSVVRGIGGSMAYNHAFGDRITRYVMVDSDYHTHEEKNQRYEQATEQIKLHIWHQKEIENYLLHPTVIARLIKNYTQKRRANARTSQRVPPKGTDNGKGYRAVT